MQRMYQPSAMRNDPVATTSARLPAPLVSVCCLTYNHQDTIAQAIEGVLAQQTDFPIELIIHDDASTDRTPEIVREYAARYPDLIRPIFQTENQYHNCNLAKTFVNPIIRGSYVAICEGDDFWTDPNKLQIQIDCMKQDPEIALCFHAVEQLDTDGSLMPYRPLKASGQVATELVIKRGGMFCPSVSLVFRRDVMDAWPAFRDAADVYDYPSQVLAAVMGKVYYIDRPMGTYRFASEGSWTANQVRATDFVHIENEVNWLGLFNEYTEKRYQSAIDYHLAHLYFTEYRKNIDPQMKQKVKQYTANLTLRERLPFTLMLGMFTVFGRSANRIWELLKKTLLK